MNKKGFTLIELLVVVVITAIFIPTVFDLFTQGSWEFLRQKTRASLSDKNMMALDSVSNDIRRTSGGTSESYPSGKVIYTFRAVLLESFESWPSIQPSTVEYTWDQNPGVRKVYRFDKLNNSTKEILSNVVLFRITNYKINSSEAATIEVISSDRGQVLSAETTANFWSLNR